MYKNSVPVVGSKPPSPSSKIAPGDNALEVIGVMLQIASEITPAVVTHLVTSLYKEYDGICGTHGEIFTDMATRGKAASTAMGIPLSQVHNAIDIVSRLIRAQRAPCVISLRYVCSSKATLAFTSHHPHTCVFEIDGPHSKQVMNTYQQIWRAFDDAGISYTFHWGKMNNLDANRVRKLYGGQRVDAWIAARRKLLTNPKLRNVFANDILRRMKMHD